jgi:hypothetical protein
VFEKKLADHGGGHFQREDEDGNECLLSHQSFSSIFATGLPTTASPRMTMAIPHQRRTEIRSARKIQQLSGTRTCTTLERGKATESGTYFRTLIQQMKLRITSAIAHHIQIEASESNPVHSQPGTRSVLEAPTFKSVSEAVTNNMSKTSINHGLRRSRGVRFMTRYYRHETIFAKPDRTLPAQMSPDKL